MITLHQIVEEDFVVLGKKRNIYSIYIYIIYLYICQCSSGIRARLRCSRGELIHNTTLTCTRSKKRSVRVIRLAQRTFIKYTSEL